MPATSPRIESLKISIRTAVIAPRPPSKRRGDCPMISDIRAIVATL